MLSAQNRYIWAYNSGIWSQFNLLSTLSAFTVCSVAEDWHVAALGAKESAAFEEVD